MGDDSAFIKIGPAGSKNGTAWDEKGHTKIVQIFVSHDDEINSIQFQYAENGAVVLSEVHGTSDGYQFDVVSCFYILWFVITIAEAVAKIIFKKSHFFVQVKFNHPSEYITKVSGYKSSNNSHLCSITFGTNRGDYGPFGKFTSKDKEFVYRLGEDRQFGGFHGTADNNGVKSIGIYLKPITSLDYFIEKINIVKYSSKESENWEMLNGVHD